LARRPSTARSCTTTS